MYKDRIRLGIQFLDEIKPNWRELIDKDTLDLQMCDKCIVGQIFAEEAGHEPVINGYQYATDLLKSTPWLYGFTLNSLEFQDWEQLQKEWLEAIG